MRSEAPKALFQVRLLTGRGCVETHGVVAQGVSLGYSPLPGSEPGSWKFGGAHAKKQAAIKPGVVDYGDLSLVKIGLIRNGRRAIRSIQLTPADFVVCQAE